MNDSATQRIDKWLWAARFFKTRSQASAAVNGGKVHLNDERVKPARCVKPGDELSISRGLYVWSVRVDAVAQRRGPASEAAMLYTEHEKSARDRSEQMEQRKMERAGVRGPDRRPDKRGRRDIIRFTRREKP